MALDQRLEPWDDPNEPTIKDVLDLSGQVTALMYIVKRMLDVGGAEFRKTVRERIDYDLGTNMWFEHMHPDEKHAADAIIEAVFIPDHGSPEHMKWPREDKA